MDHALRWQVRWFGAVAALEPYDRGARTDVLVEIENGIVWASIDWSGKIVSFTIGCDSTGLMRPIGHPIRFRPVVESGFEAVEIRSGRAHRLLDSLAASTSPATKMGQYILPDLDSITELKPPSDVVIESLSVTLRSQMSMYGELCGDDMQVVVPRFDMRDPIVFVQLLGNQCDYVLEVHQDIDDGWVGRKLFEAGDWRSVADRIVANGWLRIQEPQD